MNFNKLKELAEEGQQIAQEAYRKGAIDFYNQTKCMSDKERAEYIKGFVN